VGHLTPPETHADLLLRPLVAYLATVAKDGSPRVNPMWFLWDGDRGIVRMTHTKTRRNFLILQHEPRVALCINDPEDRLRYLQVRAVLEHIEDDPDVVFYHAIQQHYWGYTTDVRDREFRVILHLRPVGWKVR
jgi:PPOX class probable F420-dependent enzyme